MIKPATYFSTLFVLLFIPLLMNSQAPLPYTDMESWDYDSGGQYYELSGDWASTNPVSKLSILAPVTLFREDTDVYSGMYSAKLVSGRFVALPIAGLLFSGWFDDSQVTNPSEAAQLGVPFTDRPFAFKGYYKYTSVNGDSAAIVAQFHRYVNGAQELVGIAPLIEYNTVSSWTPFNIPVIWLSAAACDSMTVIFTSSAGGEDFQAADGSTLLVDEASFEYTTGLTMPLMPEVSVKVYPNPATEMLNINFPDFQENSMFSVFDSEGRLVQTQALTRETTTMDVSLLTPGHYFYQVKTYEHVDVAGKFEVSGK